MIILICFYFLDHKRAISSGETVVTQESLPSGGARPRTQGGQDDVAFRQKLKHMGKCKLLLLKEDT